MPAAVAAAAYVLGNAAMAVSGVFLSTSAAIGVGTTVAGFVASLGGLAGVGAAVQAWSTVAAVASLAQRPKIRVGTSEGGGTQVDFKADPNAPLPIAFGRTAVAGNIVHVTTDGQAHKNAHLLYVTVLSHGPIAGFESFKAGETEVTFSGEPNGGGLATSAPYAGKMVLRNSVGLQQDPAPEFAVPWVPDRIPEWSAAHKLSGLAASWYGLEYDPKVYPTGTPKPQWVVKGAKAYDPRLDSTYEGGAGACRADDPATWVWSENPYILGLTWCLGWKTNGVRVLGVGAPIESLDVAAFVEGANIADANGWTCGGVGTSSDRKWDVLSALLQAGGGTPARLGAKISCVAATPRVSLATLTARDEVVGDCTLSGTAPRRDRINRVVPRYRSEAHGWQMVSGAAVEVSAYVTEDGGQRSREVDYPLVQDAAQAAQLAAYAIVDAREFGPVTLPVKPRWLGYKPGDCITVDGGEDLALEDQKLLILTREFDPASGVVTFTCRSETDEKHDFALGRTGSPPPTPGLGGVDPGFVPAPVEGDWAIVDNKVEGPGGILPAIVIVGSVGDAQVNEVIYDYRRSLNPPTNTAFDPFVTASVPGSTTRIVIQGVGAGATYNARIRYRNLKGVEGGEDVAFDLGMVTTATIAAPTGEDLTKITDQLKDISDRGYEVQEDVERLWEEGLKRRAELEKLADSTIVDVATHVQASVKVVEDTYLKDQPLGPVVQTKSEILDDRVQTVDLLAYRTEDNMGVVLRTASVMWDDKQTVAQAVTFLAAEQGDAAKAYADEQIVVLASETEAWVKDYSVSQATYDTFTVTTADKLDALATADKAMASTLNLVAVASGDGKSARIATTLYSVDGKTALWQQQALTESMFAGKASSFLLTAAQGAANDAGAALDTLDIAGVVVETTPGNYAFRLANTTMFTNSKGSAVTLTQGINAAYTDALSASKAYADSQWTSKTGPGYGLAEQVDTLGLTVYGADGESGLKLAVTTVAEAIYDSKTGLSTRQGVALDVNGYITGYVQNNDGKSGDFNVITDRFRVVSPANGLTTPTAPFVVEGGIVYMRHAVAEYIKAGTIEADHIIGGAVTNSDVASAGSSSFGSTACTESVTTTGGRLVLILNVTAFRNTGPGDEGLGVRCRLLRNGSLVDQGTFLIPGLFTCTGSFTFEDKPAAGTYTYTIETETTAGSTGGGGVSAATLFWIELKK